MANGKTTALACKEAGIVEQTYFRWRKEYGAVRSTMHVKRMGSANGVRATW